VWYNYNMSAVIEKSHVELTPGTCGGAPRVAGTRIRVSQIVLLTDSGSSPDEIITSFPQMTLADVYAALAYYHDHRELIDAEIRAGNEAHSGGKAAAETSDADSVSS
jgi:uncharacterized protein (DUF433 family)